MAEPGVRAGVPLAIGIGFGTGTKAHYRPAVATDSLHAPSGASCADGAASRSDKIPPRPGEKKAAPIGAAFFPAMTLWV